MKLSLVQGSFMPPGQEMDLGYSPAAKDLHGAQTENNTDLQ